MIKLNIIKSALIILALYLPFLCSCGNCEDEYNNEDEDFVVHVKKDGTGDFTSIQEAIDSIKDASIEKQYKILVYDNWEIDDVQDLNNNDYWYYLFATKDYIHVKGVGKHCKLSISLPDDIAPDYIERTQTVFVIGNSSIENFEVQAKNARYAIHIDKETDVNCMAKIKNCIITHQGNDHAVNFLSWTSDYALGIGSQSDHQLYIENCELYARSQVSTYHTNIYFDDPSFCEFKDCKFVSGDKSLNMNITELGSAVKNRFVFKNCDFNAPVNYEGAWYFNNDKRDDASTLLIDIEIVDCPTLDLRKLSFGEVLSFAGCNVSEDNAGIYGENITNEKANITHGKIEISENNIFGEEYTSALGNRLGDCSVNKKTLTITGAINKTIIFDKNYGGNVEQPPLYSNKQIIDEINFQLGSNICSIIYLRYNWANSENKDHLIINEL